MVFTQRWFLKWILKQGLIERNSGGKMKPIACMSRGHLKGSPAKLSFIIYLSDELRGFVLEGLLRNPDEIPKWFLRGIQQDHN